MKCLFFVLLFLSFNALAVDPPTELTAIKTADGVELRWRGDENVLKYNLYHDGKYKTTLQFKRPDNGDMPAYRTFIDKVATEATRISLVSIVGTEANGDIGYSPQSKFVIPRTMPELAETVGNTGQIANTIESLITLGSIGLGATAGDYVCINASVTVNDSVRLPSARFCFEIDKQF